MAGAIEAIMPAIEIVDSRIAGLDDVAPNWKLADHRSTAGLYSERRFSIGAASIH